jgi:glucose-1-phosphate cytidylyltransferase
VSTNPCFFSAKRNQKCEGITKPVPASQDEERILERRLCLGVNMKVVIVCGGMGTRLREETEFKPKPMVNIGSRPILWHIMKIYSHYGYNEFILCLGYKGETIKEYFLNYEILNSDFTVELGNGKNVRSHNCHNEKDWKVTLADTGEFALKGARLKKVEKYVDGDTFMMTYGDGISNVNIKELIEFHQSHGRVATVTGTNYTSRFGELKIKGDRVIKFVEKEEFGTTFVSAGFFVFNRGIFDYLVEDDRCDLEIGPLERIAEAGELAVYKHRGFWAPMDTLRDMDYLNALWNQNRAVWKIW